MASSRRRFPIGTAVPLVAGAYTYVGFPLIASWLARRERPRSFEYDELPTVSVIIPALNESLHIADKVRNSLDNGYPPDLIEVIVVDDHSDDDTAQLAKDAGAHVVRRAFRGGKCEAINTGVDEALSEIIVVTDANGYLNDGAIRRVVDQFADPEVGLVSGAKDPVGATAHGVGERVYWQFEGGIRHQIGTMGVLDGADGAVFAFRRDWFQPIPAGVLNDDFYLALSALSDGHRVTHAQGAYATEDVSPTVRQEFRRRARISAGIWQGSLRFLSLADPRRGKVAFVFTSHRLLRSLVMPCLLPILLVSTVRNRRSVIPRLVLLGELLTYGGAAAGAVTGQGALGVPLQFTMLNVAAIRGGVRHLLGRQRVTWERIPRELGGGAPSRAPRADSAA